MYRSLAGLALLSTVLTGPALAQGRETEFGADMVVKWMKSSGGGSGVFHIQTPVDFRVAFHTGGNVAFEPRLTALYLSGGGDNMYSLDPGLNVLIGLPGSTRTNGSYVTIGADLELVGGSGLTGVSYYSVNAGLGLRRPMGKAATRAELFVGFTPKQGTTIAESIITLGARLGISFFN